MSIQKRIHPQIVERNKLIKQLRSFDSIKRPKRWRQYSEQQKRQWHFEEVIMWGAHRFRNIAMTSQEVKDSLEIFRKHISKKDD